MPTIPRRAVLSAALGGTAWVVTGCASSDLPIIGRHNPDDDLRLATALSEAELVAAYRAAAGRLRPLATQLNVIRLQHEQHLQALLAGLGQPAPTSTQPAPDVSNRAAALRTLRRMESGAARERARGCVEARDTEVVELLARIGASEAAHVAALDDLRDSPR